MGKWIKSDGKEIQVRPVDEKYYSLKQLQRLVGGYIETANQKDLDFIKDLTQILFDYKADVLQQVIDMLWEQYTIYDKLLDNGISVYLESIGSPRSESLCKLRHKLRVKMIGLLRCMSLIKKMQDKVVNVTSVNFVNR